MISEITKRARNLRKDGTLAEKILWQNIRNGSLNCKFVRQKPIVFYYGNKKRFFIADFFSRQAKLIIEVDGKIHDDQKEYDQARDYVINQLGFRVVRIKNEKIYTDIEKVLQEISNYI